MNYVTALIYCKNEAFRHERTCFFKMLPAPE